MKETGVVRRLDELGRVVIPKEIRKRLKINNGDMVDIYTSDDHIILEKYHPLNQDIIPIKAMLEALAQEYSFHLILFDDTRVIYSTLKEIASEEPVCGEFIQKIPAYLDKELSSKMNLELTDSYKFDKDIYIQRIIVNYESYGYIMVVDDIIGKKHKEALAIIDYYFQHILEEN